MRTLSESIIYTERETQGVDKLARLRLTLVIAKEPRSDGSDDKDRVYLKWTRPLGGAFTVRPGPIVT